MVQKWFRDTPQALTSAADYTDLIAEEVNLTIENVAKRLQDKGHLDENTRPCLVTKLQGAPQRTYLWVQLFEYFENSDIPNATTEINRIIDTPPAELSETYESLYEKMIGISKNNPCARKVFSIMLSACRELTVKEIHLAMELTLSSSELPEFYPNFELMLRNWCGLLVTVDTSGVPFLH